MKSRWVEHKGRQVFIADFSYCGTETFKIQEECRSIILELNGRPDKSVYSIADVNGTVATPGNLNALKNLLSITNKYVVRRGVVGLDGPRRAFIDLINKLTGGTRFTTFTNMDDALDWIVIE